MEVLEKFWSADYKCVCVWGGVGNRVQKVEEWVFYVFPPECHCPVTHIFKKPSTTHKALKEVSVYRHLLACA